jgi:plasmid stabilization system protein ParE
MKHAFILHPEARSEIGSAALWYEDRSQGLGSDFLRSVDAVFAQIQRNPQQFAAVHGSIRRALLRRFPYAVLFVESDTAIRVIACSHVRQNPERWKLRG